MSNTALKKTCIQVSLLFTLISVSACVGGPKNEGALQNRSEGNITMSSTEIEWRICTWPQDKQAAVTLTFDDGTLDQYEVALPLLEKYGVAATYFLITGPRDTGVWEDGIHSRRLFDWDAAVDIASKGHEIGSHGVSHRDLRRLLWLDELSEIERELQWSRMEIQRYIPEEYRPAGNLLSFSWPYWRSTSELEHLAGKYYIAARSGRGRLPLRIPPNSHSINSVRVMSDDSPTKWRQNIEKARNAQGWLLFSLHGIDNGHMAHNEIGWQPVSDDKFSKLLGMTQDPDLWTAPLGEVFRYSTERMAARLEIEALQPGRIMLRLEDGLDDKVFDQPLTVELTLPEEYWNGFSGAVVESVKSGDSTEGHLRAVVTQLERAGRGKTLRFDLLPNGELVVLRGVVIQLYDR